MAVCKLITSNKLLNTARDIVVYASCVYRWSRSPSGAQQFLSWELGIEIASIFEEASPRLYRSV